MTKIDWRKAGVCDSVSQLRDTILPNDVKQFGRPSSRRPGLADMVDAAELADATEELGVQAMVSAEVVRE